MSATAKVDLRNMAGLPRYFQVLQNIHCVIRLSDLIVDTAFAYNNIETLFIEPALSKEYVRPEEVKEKAPATTSLLEALESSKRLVILGDPGSGKSTIVNWLVNRFATSSPNVFRMRLGDLVPIPFVLREYDLSTVGSWEDLVNQFCDRPEFRQSGAPIDADLIQDLLESGQALVLFDGIDELGSLSMRANLRNIARDAIRGYPKSSWVFTSRILGYDESPFDTHSMVNATTSLGENWEVADYAVSPGSQVADLAIAQLYVVPLDDVRIDRYARLWYGLLEKEPSKAEASAKSLSEAVRNHESLSEVARIPILLAYLAIVHLRDWTLPDGRTEVYRRVAETFLGAIPAKRGLDGTPYRLDQKMRWLGKIGLAMQARRFSERPDSVLILRSELLGLVESAMVTDDSRTTRPDAERFLEFIARRAGLLLPRGEEEYGFIHLSFQEFFAGFQIAAIASQRSFDPTRLAYLADSEYGFRQLQEAAETGEINTITLPALLEQWSLGSVMTETLLHATCLLDEESALLLLQAASACPRPLRAEEPRRTFLVAASESHSAKLGENARLTTLAVAGSCGEWVATIANHPNNAGKEMRAHSQPSDLMLRLSSVSDCSLPLLASLSGLESLDLMYAKITDLGLSSFSSLSRLQTLSLCGTQITDSGLPSLTELSSLRSLNLAQTNVTDAGLETLSSLTELRDLDLSYTRITDLGLSALRSMVGLENLKLSNTLVTDAGLASLSCLTNLHSLELSGAGITDEGLSILSSMTSLRSVDLSRMRITDSGVSALSSLPNLLALGFYQVPITDSGLTALSSLTALERLTMSLTEFTDAALPSLSSLTNLNELQLGGREVTDAGLSNLSSMSSLEILNLSGSQVTDSGLFNLSHLTKLRSLYLYRTRITDAGLSALQSLTGLQELYLGETLITDSGLSELSCLTSLQILNLEKTKVTDFGLPELSSLIDLRKLDLHGTGVTIRGLRSVFSWEVFKNLRELDAGIWVGAGLRQVEIAEFSSTFSRRAPRRVYMSPWPK